MLTQPDFLPFSYSSTSIMNLYGHIQTIVPSIFRKHQPLDFQSEEIPTPDGDFLELDWYKQKSDNLVIVTHGLEGDSQRPYMVGMAMAFFKIGYDCILWNFRSCGSRMNNKPILYHSGSTYDLETIIQHAAEKGYKRICLIGFSLGGNITLKYLGEKGITLNPLIKKAAVFSVPCHLSSGSNELGKWYNKIYSWRFLRSLKAKMLEKAINNSDIKTKVPLLNDITTIRQFDDLFTAPLHGFIDAEDYYNQNSSIRFIEEITIPTLIANAINDPFLPAECYPIHEAAINKNITLMMPEKGGHCGFSLSGGIYWSETVAVDFCSQ